MEAIVNATVLPMTAPGARAEAIAFDRGRIVAVGSRAAVLAAAGAPADVIDARGGAVLPGFIDAHNHYSLAAVYEGCVDCVFGVVRMRDLLTRLGDAARTIPEDRWIVGTRFDPLLIAERRFPTRDELDEACPGRAVVVLHTTFHQGAASTVALERAGITKGVPDPPGGIIERGRGGLPTGRLLEAGVFRVEQLARESLARVGVETLIDRLLRLERSMFAAGITRLADPSVSPDLEALYRAARGRLRLPIVMMPTSGDGLLAPPWDRLESAPTGEGDDQLTTGALKLWMDGGIHCSFCMNISEYLATSLKSIGLAIRTGSLDPFRLGLDQRLRREKDGRIHGGVQILGRDRARELFRAAAERGFALAVHAGGNLAIEAALDAFEGVRFRAAAPCRIEHGTVMPHRLIPRVRDSGLILSVQPIFLRLPGLALAAAPAGSRCFPLRALKEAGVPLAGGSDAPVMTSDVLEGVRVATTRRGYGGRVIDPEETIHVEDALAMYTREAARAIGCERVAGTLEPGKRADLVITGVDPCSNLEGARVVRTVLAGETVFVSHTPPA